MIRPQRHVSAPSVYTSPVAAYTPSLGLPPAPHSVRAGGGGGMRGRAGTPLEKRGSHGEVRPLRRSHAGHPNLPSRSSAVDGHSPIRCQRHPTALPQALQSASGRSPLAWSLALVHQPPSIIAAADLSAEDPPRLSLPPSNIAEGRNHGINLSVSMWYLPARHIRARRPSSGDDPATWQAESPAQIMTDAPTPPPPASAR